MHSEARERVEGGIRSGIDPLRVGAGVAVSVLLVAGLAVLVGPERLLGPLRAGDPLLLAGAAAAAIAGLLLRGWAAAVLFYASGAPAAGARFYLLYAFAVLPKHVVPGGYAAGPVITAYALTRDSRRGFEPAVASFGVAELLNLVVSLAVAATGLSLFVALGGATAVGGDGVLLGAAVLLATVSVGTVLVLRSERTGATVVRAATVVGATVGAIPPARHLRTLVAGWIDGRGDDVARTALALSGDRRAVSTSIAISTAAALVSVAPLYLCLVAIDAPASVPVVLVVVPVAGLLGMTPLPGGIGGIELAMTGLLIAIGGVDPALAAAATILYRLTTFGVITLFGAVAAGVLTATGGRPALS